MTLIFRKRIVAQNATLSLFRKIKIIMDKINNCINQLIEMRI